MSETLAAIQLGLKVVGAVKM
jgi:hypothetical protein